MHAHTHTRTWESLCSDGRPPVTGSVGCTGTTTIIVNRLIIQTPESGGDPQQEGGGAAQKTPKFFFSFCFKDFFLVPAAFRVAASLNDLKPLAAYKDGRSLDRDGCFRGQWRHLEVLVCFETGRFHIWACVIICN